MDDMQSKEPRGIKRIVFRAFLWACIGLFVSLLQAWSSVLLADYDSVNGGLDGSIDDARQAHVGYGPLNDAGHAWVFRLSEISTSLSHVRSSNAILPIDRDRFVEQWGEPVLSQVLPHYSRATRQPVASDINEPDFVVHQELFAGWPFKGWGATVSSDLVSRVAYRWCVPYLPQSPNSWGMASVLPLRPLLPEVVLNALLYAGSAYVLYRLMALVLRKAIRFRRLRNRLCPNCGYDSSGLVACPECGFAVSSPTGRPSSPRSTP